MPRTFVFGAKAAPGYHMAKLIIKLINSVADVVNHDPDVRNRLKVVFLPNFNVTLAERIYPAADISEQISMAGKEASGTGNMKFALNGAMTVGTLDGANIEIRERVGAENFFLFGLTADEVFAAKSNGYNPRAYYETNAELRRAIDSHRAPACFPAATRSCSSPLSPACSTVMSSCCWPTTPPTWRRPRLPPPPIRTRERWTRMSILNSARCGFFSSDRAIQEYCDDIWGVQPVRIE